MAIIPNALVSIDHIDGTVDRAIAVSIQVPANEQVASQGGLITYEIHFPPTIRMTQGDVITVLQLFGHPLVEQVKITIATYPKRIAGMLPHTCVEVSGVYL